MWGEDADKVQAAMQKAKRERLSASHVTNNLPRPISRNRSR
ncbi:hypothetical protein GEW_08212 [Pasteurella multocida subsp. gallicida str. Anand1_poultry]|nr:hypothetical protein GEW_08212 [Pasteurella multocida subsp. gallicida str. Anand1_poultry]